MSFVLLVFVAQRVRLQLSELISCCPGGVFGGPDDSFGDPSMVLIATGSEVELAMQVAKELEGKTPLRVVSMPCTERFDLQPLEYQQKVLGKNIKRVAIEASHSDWWRKYVGLEGDVIGMETFGESAAGNILFEHFGFTKEKIISKLDLDK